MQERIISRLFAAWISIQHDLMNAGHFRMVKLWGLAAAFFLGGLATSLLAQHPTATPEVSNLLSQQLPGPGNPVQTPGSGTVRPQSSADIVVTVRDSNAAPIPGVQVMLVGQNGAVEGAMTPNDNGVFRFAGVSPGTYRVKINAAGLEPYVSDDVILGAGEKLELPLVVMQIATETTTVNVVATSNDVAQAQVQAQEKQRVLGFLPNYYTSYIWNAAPMMPKLKFKLALRTTTDPVAFLVAAGVAGAEQAHHTFPGYGLGAEGYAKRFGATYADMVALRMLGGAVFPTLLHQDPRYFYMGSGSTRSRVLHALAATFIRKGDDGRPQPNYSQLLGNFGAAGLSNLYRSPADRTAGLTLRNGLIITASGTVENLLREFLSRKLTPNVPGFANGKP